MDKNHAGRVADEARFIAKPSMSWAAEAGPVHGYHRPAWVAHIFMGYALLTRPRAGGTIMRIRGIIMILLTLVLFGLAIASLMGFHFSISTGTVSWGPG